ncbi:PREDICTED: protein SMG5 [Ceratosolen solmsi marchali]|uniref:Protein SMG5 n=1 Tax=Ceratosolen solmsi marchali TaxID=326594 RepID=A0AAJ7DTX9_9HYME|nr:PREDICTED: protein SMG5 [Ceratosolen solmsi marchali]
MKKNYNIGTDLRISNNFEITRRLYRNITEIAKKLEEQKNHALTIIDVFTPSGEALRSKLRDYCERLIIEDPVNHVQKTEELLWRRGFYDIVATAKKLRKGNNWNDMEKAFLSAHLSVGVGFYHHLILRLQLEYDLNLTGVLDFAYPQSQKQTVYIEKCINPLKIQTAELKKCVFHFIHRSLVCLGDLARYRLDLDPNWDPQIATRYYKMAVAVNNKHGMPHNQMGTVASNRNYGLDAVYHYMRSILCQEPFEGAEGNLKRTVTVHAFNGKEKCLAQCCVARLLLLLQLWDNNSMNTDRINQETQLLLQDIENCLNVKKSHNIDYKSAENQDSIENYLSCYKNYEASNLTDDMIFKIIVICLMKILKIQMKESNDAHGIITFVLAVFSQLIQFVVMRLQESLLNVSVENRNNKLEIMNDDTDEITNSVHDTNEAENKNENNNDLKIRPHKSDCFNDTKKIEVNGNHVDEKIKKHRDKSKYLLTKLRRPRNRRNSSDSDASDGEVTVLESSSEDINSDVTETEADVLSDENILSDEVLSDDLTDDENPATGKKTDNKDTVSEQINGHDKDEKFIEESENEDQNDVTKIIVNNKGKESEDKTEVTKNSNESCDENTTLINTLPYIAQKEKNPIKVLAALNNERILISIKVCCDWLQGHHDIIRTCTKESKSLLKRFIALLNLINLDGEDLLNKWNKELEIFSCSEKLKETVESVPLPEDIDVRGLKMFENAHKNINWEILRRRKVMEYEETLLRALKIVKFGHYLCLMKDSGVIYDDNQNLFIVLDQKNNIKKENQIDNKILELDHSKGKLMRHMGKLWLKAEVRALENRLHFRLMSPYLVPDHEAFSKFMPILKHLVYAKKFIVVIPSVVVSALDELKKSSIHAREATRWLETQLQCGSQFLRAQRPHEKLPLPLIKEPKSKDKEAWLYFQIIECCHYLTQQNKAGDTEIPVVTLLTGIDDKKVFSFSPDGLAKSAGVNFEHISAFHAKWKLSVKSHG